MDLKLIELEIFFEFFKVNVRISEFQVCLVIYFCCDFKRLWFCLCWGNICEVYVIYVGVGGGLDEM